MRARGLRRLNKAPCRKGGRPCKKAKPRPAEANQGIAVFGSGATITYGEESDDPLTSTYGEE